MAEALSVSVSAQHPASAQLEQRGAKLAFLSLRKYDPQLLSQGVTGDDVKARNLVPQHNFKSHVPGRMAARGTSIATIVHLHDENLSKPPLRFLFGRPGPSTYALIGLS